MHANNLVINDRTAGQAIKRVAKLLPHFYRESTAALIVKTVDTVNAGTFVVPTEQEKVLGILYFVGKQETDNFEGLLATVDIITKEQIVCLEVW